MDAATFLISLLNGLSVGLLLFMLASGLTLIFSMMGVLNFAHASFYMLGAYAAFSIAQRFGFWWGLLLAPLAVGLAGAAFERWVLRRVRGFGHLPELLITFGLAFIVLETVQLVWGRQALEFKPPASLAGPWFTVVDLPGSLGLAWGGPPAACKTVAGAVCTQFGQFRAFGMALAVGMLVALWLLLKRTRVGLVIRAALTHPEMVETLGHDLPRVRMLVFGGGTALAALAGVVGGVLRVTEPSMALAVGSLVFAVIVIGGMGSLAGAFVASLALGLIESFAVGSERLAPVAAVLPYLLLVGMLLVRPRGLLGTREG
jgi:branched-chain amino acid transport system permease protein